MRKRSPNFDRIAPLYRWLEYLTFGPMLERCRFYRLPELTTARRALILGDGDGRFLAKLLKTNPDVRIDAIDLSPAMLRLLEARVRRPGLEARSRLTVHCADARDFSLPHTVEAGDYDLIVTHFFLDCLTDLELSRLMDVLRPHIAPGTRWLVSEFRIPEQGLSAKSSLFIVSSLYRAFGVLTGLEVRELPAWNILLKNGGFSRDDQRTWLGGLLTSELWSNGEST
jgi:SAM-dependent methyltransferase